MLLIYLYIKFSAHFYFTALATSSGLGATLLLTHLLKSGDHIVCGDDVYGGTSTE